MFYIHWDTEPCSEVEEITNETDMENIERKKCGGTDFTELFSHELVRQQDVDLYVVVTDGWPCGWPKEEPPGPHVWIITEKDGYKAYQEQYGKGIGVDVSEN